MANSYILEALNITKRFPGVVANKDVTLQVRQGEILGLIGENGAGKSTLLGIINGVHPYGSYEGILKVNGQEVRNYSTHDAQEKGIGFVPQEINVLGHLSVAENIFVADLASHGNVRFYINYRNLYRDAQALLDEYGIRLNARDKAQMLSVGKQQMLMIARALAQKPKILILDEPTTSLTINDIEILYDLMRGLKAKGVSILFVSHKLDEILTITDRVFVLRDGCNSGLLDRKNYDRNKIIEYMVGRKIEQLYPKRDIKPGEEILRIENLYVDHPKIMNRYLLKDVSFSLRKGEVLGFAGLIGAGRTETLRAIYGAIKRKRGDIYFNGRKINIRKESDAIKYGFAYVTEDRKCDGLLWLRNILENLTINSLDEISDKGFLNQKRVKKKGMKYFKIFGIKANRIEDMPQSLSGGNQQKLVVARAMGTEPKILLLDEPTKGIDIGAKNEIYNIINDLVANGVSIIMVSSELPELLAMCDRFIVMADGEIKGELSKEEVSEHKIMMLAAQ